MRNVDERMAAVRVRVAQTRRKRERGAVALAAVAAFLCVGSVAGMSAFVGSTTGAPFSSTLFGATSVFGPGVGGYVLVALISGAVAVLVTVLCVRNRKLSQEAPEGEGGKQQNATVVEDAKSET